MYCCGVVLDALCEFGECFVGEGMSTALSHHNLCKTCHSPLTPFTGIEGTYLISQQLGAASRNVLAAAEIHTPAGSVFFGTLNVFL